MRRVGCKVPLRYPGVGLFPQQVRAFSAPFRAKQLGNSFPPQRFPLHKIPVLDNYGRKVFDRSPAEAARMVALHQGKWTPDHRCLRFINPGREHEHPCRTHTSRGGPLGGQLYTTKRHGQVDGFKRIFAEDRDFFRAAVLDCFKTLMKPTGCVWYIDANAMGVFMEAKSS